MCCDPSVIHDLTYTLIDFICLNLTSCSAALVVFTGRGGAAVFLCGDDALHSVMLRALMSRLSLPPSHTHRFAFLLLFLFLCRMYILAGGKNAISLPERADLAPSRSAVAMSRET